MKVKASDENIIISKKEKKNQLKQIEEYRKQLMRCPQLKSLFIEMTLNCNEHCRHCGSWCGDVKMKDQLTDDEIKDFLKQLKVDCEKRNMPLPFLNITGGEPLVRKGMVELMKYVHDELGYHWGMTTNGLLIDKKMAKNLKDAGMYSVSISVDGLEETHDWFRQSPGGYKKAIQALINLKEQNFGHIMATTVVHKRCLGELDELYLEMKKLGIDCWRVVNVEPIGRAKNNQEIGLNGIDYKYIIDFIKKHREEDQEMEVSYGCNHYLGLEYEKEIRAWYFLCNAGIYTAGVQYNGDIGACLDIERLPETIQGNVRKDNLMDVWENKFEIFRKDKTTNSPECKNCKKRDFCAGGGFHTWDVETCRPRICMYKEIQAVKAYEKKKAKLSSNMQEESDSFIMKKAYELKEKRIPKNKKG